MTARTLESSGTGGPGVLLLHGLSDSADTWRPLLHVLEERGRRARAVDLPSHGSAPPIRRDRPAFEQLVDAAEAALEGLGPAPVVVGNSLGGTVALLLAQRRPDLGAVVPIGPGAFAHPWWLRASLRTPAQRAFAAVPAVAKLPAHAATALASGMSLGATCRHVAQLAVAGRQRAHHRLVLGLAADADPYDLGSIRCPVVVVWGDRDRFSLPAGAALLATAAPHARVEILRGGRHCPQHQFPERIADLLDDIGSPSITGQAATADWPGAGSTRATPSAGG